MKRLRIDRPGFSTGMGAFSLVEVVVALGIFSFVLVTITGLLSLGLNTNKQSSDQIQAADLASLLLATRRASPNTVIANFAIPPLASSTSVQSNAAPIQVSVDGTTTVGGLSASDIYNLNYLISPGATPHVAVVHLLLWWPSTASSPPSDSMYEITTQIAHP